MKLREFIETKKDLINSRNFTGLYRSASLYLSDTARGELTSLFYKIGVDPLLYMTSMPPYFLYGLHFDKFEVPIGIKDLNNFVFKNSNINELILPKTLKVIDINAFVLCKIKSIGYLGTISQLKRITNYYAIIQAGVNAVECIDGFYDLRT